MPEEKHRRSESTGLSGFSWSLFQRAYAYFSFPIRGPCTTSTRWRRSHVQPSTTPQSSAPPTTSMVSSTKLIKHKLTMTGRQSTPTSVTRTIIKKHLNTPSPDSSQSMTTFTSMRTKTPATSSFPHGPATSAQSLVAPARWPSWATRLRPTWVHRPLQRPRTSTWSRANWSSPFGQDWHLALWQWSSTTH